VAIERFGDRGYRGTSVSEIARTVGVTQAAAYTYFESKRALFVAALDADATALVFEAGSRCQDEPVTSLAIRFLVELFAGVEQHPLAHRVLAGKEPELKGFPELIELPAVRLATSVMVREMIEAQSRGEVRDDIDVELVGAGIEGIILSILVATVQVGSLGTERRRQGVMAAFAAMIEPVG
jgi:AcrR family transcriptional regulator